MRTATIAACTLLAAAVAVTVAVPASASPPSRPLPLTDSVAIRPIAPYQQIDYIGRILVGVDYRCAPAAAPSGIPSTLELGGVQGAVSESTIHPIVCDNQPHTAVLELTNPADPAEPGLELGRVAATVTMRVDSGQSGTVVVAGGSRQIYVVLPV